MSRFPLYLRRQLEFVDKANVDRATRTAHLVDNKTYTATLAGDARKLRGIPAIGRNVRGAIPGTNPEDSLRNIR